MTDLTPEQRLQDELILAAIIAGGMASGRRVAPALCGRRPCQPGHRNGYGVMDESESDGPCCAVGAGVLFSGVTVTSDALKCFAGEYGVTADYAQGVSSGFENDSWANYGGDVFDVGHDVSRGIAVGSAAWDFFCGDEA